MTRKCYTRISPGRVAQSVTCLTTDTCMTADPWVASSIPAWSHTFVEINREIISMVFLLPSADSLSVTSESNVLKVLVNRLFKFAQEKKCG